MNLLKVTPYTRYVFRFKRAERAGQVLRLAAMSRVIPQAMDTVECNFTFTTCHKIASVRVCAMMIHVTV